MAQAAQTHLVQADLYSGERDNFLSQLRQSNLRKYIEFDFAVLWDASRADWVTTCTEGFKELERAVLEWEPPLITEQCVGCSCSPRDFYLEWTNAGFPMQCPCCCYWLRDAVEVCYHIQHPEECRRFRLEIESLHQGTKEGKEHRFKCGQTSLALSTSATWTELRYLCYSRRRDHPPQLCPECHVLFATIPELQQHLCNIWSGSTPPFSERFVDNSGKHFPPSD